MSLLQNMRSKAKGIVAKALIALLIVAMAAFGLDAFFYDQRSGGSSTLTINGRGVTEAEIENAVFQYKQQIGSQFGQEYAEQVPEATLTEGAINSLTQQITLLQQTEHYELTASDEAVQQSLAAADEFRSDTGFNREAFINYLQTNNITSQQLRENIRESIALQTLPRFSSYVGFPTDKEKDLIAAVVYETRDIQYTTIAYADFESAAQPSTEDIQAHYNDNKASYQSPEQASFQYLVIDKSAISAQISGPSEDAIQLAYQNHLAELSQDNRYEISHILVDLSSRDEEKAKERASQAKARIDSGTAFNDLVDEYSDDPGSKAKNGSLGLINPDDFVPELSDQIKLMSEGDIAGPFLSNFGYHIIRLDAEPGSNKPSLDELREILVKQLNTQQVSDTYEQQKNDLGNSTFSASDLHASAAELTMTVQDTDFLPTTGAENSEDLFANKQIIYAAFSADVVLNKLNSQVIDLGDKAVVLRLKEYQEQRQLPIDEVEDTIRATLVSSLSQTMAIEYADKILTAVHANGDQKDAELLSDTAFLDTLATLMPQGIGLDWTIDKGLQAVSQPENPDIANVTFTLHNNGILQKETRANHVYLGLITASRKPLFSELKQQEQESIDQELTQSSASQYVSALYALLKNNAVISNRTEQ